MRPLRLAGWLPRVVAHVAPRMREISRRLGVRNSDALAAYVASRP